MWVLCIFLILLALSVIYKIAKDRFSMIDDMFPGPPYLPFIGNAKDAMGNSEQFYNKVAYYFNTYKTTYRMWMSYRPYVALCEPEHAEALLSSNTNIDKSADYDFLLPWIGYGLLTSTGRKWKKHRKILTPAFHFKILEKFVDVFNNNGDILCSKLKEEANKEPFDVYEYIKLYALDNICETAMGLQINAQTNPKSEYVRAIKDICATIFHRAINLWYRADIIFDLSSYGFTQRRALKVIHKVTNEVIQKRKAELKNTENVPQLLEEDKELNVKQKLAFLDILLLAAEEQSLTDEDIAAEVDTFMFEGHDTITSGISFAIYCLATHPHFQELAFQEQKEIFGEDNRLPTFRDLQEMKYLEQVVKESLRLYPSVPFIGRRITEDLQLGNGKYLPKGIEAVVVINAINRNPKTWKNPEEFNPDNFSPDALQGKHPYAATPFSAGPRNCIGQKFALLEMKAALSKLLRSFQLLPSPNKNDKPRLMGNLVLISVNGIKIRVTPRHAPS